MKAGQNNKNYYLRLQVLCRSVNRITCELCDKKMTKFQYKRHVETVHGVNVGEENLGKFECEDCHKEYKNLDTLRQHKKIKKHMEYSKDSVSEIDQEELVKYKCDDCGKEYEAAEVFIHIQTEFKMHVAAHPLS
jgi:hypothetical protein